MTGFDHYPCKAARSRRAGPVVFRILPHKFRAKARSEGPSGNRALLAKPFKEITQPFSMLGLDLTYFPKTSASLRTHPE
jgi:hypothetical protein